MRMSALYASVSVVCVYNDLAVREECLDGSIQALSDEASDFEYLPIDNVNGTYSSAGAALNHGVSLARKDVVVFVHQDVFLHSLASLKRAAGQTRAEGFGLMGAVGIRSDGRIVGRVRDRVVLLGEAVARPTEVDSVDEVLFMAPRSSCSTSHSRNPRNGMACLRGRVRPAHEETGPPHRSCRLPRPTTAFPPTLTALTKLTKRSRHATTACFRSARRAA